MTMLDPQLLAVFLVAFPLVLAIGIVLIPVVVNYADHEKAERAAAQTRRWFWGHLISAIGFGLGVVAACCLGLFLVDAGEAAWALAGVPLAAVGAGTMAAGLGADGIGPLAVQKAGHPARLFFDGSRVWVTGTTIAGAILFSLGQIALVVGVQHTDLLSTAVGITVIVAAIAFSVSTAVPSGYALYLVAVSALVAYLPMAFALWRLG